VVSKAQAKLHMLNEVCSGLDKTHNGLPKFTSEDDDGFKTFLAFVESISKTTEPKTVLETQQILAPSFNTDPLANDNIESTKGE
jgi:hypothetical protein